MPCYRFEDMVPVVDPTSFVHPTASLIGDVQIGPRCYIGPGASLRGDFGRIVIIGESSVQDNCTLHTSSISDIEVGFGSTVGHGAVLHGCKLEEHVLIGMKSVVLDGAVIGSESLVAAMSLVKNDQVFAARSLIAGNPAKLIKTMTAEAILWRNGGKGGYVELAERSLAGLEACTPLPQAEPDRQRNRSTARAVRLKT